MSTTHLWGMLLKGSKYKTAKWVYFVKECSFTFQFVSLEQIEEYINYFEHKVHPTSIAIAHYG